ncbi:MAG: hypothetical protein C4306_01805, partial [Thermoleophilia bacterium]
MTPGARSSAAPFPLGAISRSSWAGRSRSSARSSAASGRPPRWKARTREPRSRSRSNTTTAPARARSRARTATTTTLKAATTKATTFITATEATTTSAPETFLPRGRPHPGAADHYLAELYDRHGRTILGLCRLLLRDPAEAEDAAQQTFLSALASLRSGTVPRHPAAWLATIARNECWERIQRRMRQPLAA